MAEIRGRVRGGGDQTPLERAGGPRRFVYQVTTEDGSVVDVTYTAFPPSPAAERLAGRVRLRFHAGAIRAGDYIVARGRLSADGSTLEVGEEGDSIETSPHAP